ncbi:EXS family-domain-containing protein [Neurospora crassa]|nr:EXS family-domain-containing protein [Neurospora crassa]
MDGDPVVEPELDSFSLTFPLPYRVAFIVIIDRRPSLIRYPGRSSPTQLPHHHSTYRLATLLSLSSAVSILTFWSFTRRDPKRVIDYDWIPMTNLAVTAALFVLPLRRLSVSHSGRRRLLATLRRVSVGGLAEAKDGKFGDILLADVLTSYAKVLGDLFICLCMFFTRNGSATDRPDRSCGGTYLVPLLLTIPSAIRLRQCLIEYLRVRNSPFKDLYRAWIVACLLNSLYSFYWDVAKDWDLTLFAGAQERNSPDHPFGLRRRLLIHKPVVYYFVIALDLALRCTWMIKLHPHLNTISDFESSIFLIEFCEVFRRWVWIFFRVETEWIRNTSTGLGVDDILMSNFNTRNEDEEYVD